MFTGIIEGQAKVKQIQATQNGAVIFFEAPFVLEGFKIGDSIAINGACLTAVKIENNFFSVDVAPETLSLTTLGTLKEGELVNFERALKLNGRLDGHLVSGHIDGVGKIISKETKGNAILFRIEVNKELSYYMIKKGSVAIDGISLTINSLNTNSFDISIIPHTLSLTTLNSKNIGSKVNIETDIVGKYLEKFTNKKSESKIDKEFLLKAGFL